MTTVPIVSPHVGVSSTYRTKNAALMSNILDHVPLFGLVTLQNCNSGVAS